jgi:hypothetical protein
MFIFEVLLMKTTQKQNKMATYKSIQITASEVKKEMKNLGIKVLRAAQNKSGVLITIVNNVENQQKAIEYFNNNSMGVTPSLNEKIRTNCSYNYVDYGTIYKWIAL